MSEELLRGLAGLFLVLALSSMQLSQQTACLALLLGQSCRLVGSQNLQEGLSGIAGGTPGTPARASLRAAASRKGTQAYLSARDTSRAVFGPPGWMLTPLGKLLPLAGKSLPG